jgi:acyl carrier protein
MSDQIKQILSQIFMVPVGAIDDDSSPASIASWDSLKHMQLVLALEEEFSIEFPDDVVPNLNSVASIESAVQRLVSGAS